MIIALLVITSKKDSSRFHTKRIMSCRFGLTFSKMKLAVPVKLLLIK